MSNFNKSFNFRNGVQVDDTNFVVNRNGLVGIGTSIPTQILDVYGVSQFTGLSTFTQIMASGISTFSDLRVGVTSIGPGFITATSSSGVVTYYGDGGRLLNLPTSQWLDIDVGLGFTSIYAQGFVGVQTNDPRFALQIGANPLLGGKGVGIDSGGNILTSGIITATVFSGPGADITNLNADNLTSGTVPLARIPQLTPDKLPSDFVLSGIITAAGFVGDLTGTATTALSLSGTPNVVVGIATASSFVGPLTGVASSASSLVGVPNITVNNVTALSVGSTGVVAGFSSVGVSTAQTFHIGLGGTVLSGSTTGNIGIGSAIPTAPLQIRRNGDVDLDLTSDTGTASFTFGRVRSGDSNGEIRYGLTPRNVDVINHDTGNLNLYLHLGSTAGINTGSFAWIYGQTSTQLMNLTYQGRLGIGRTDPSETFEVVGTSTVTSNSFVGGTLDINGPIRFGTGSTKGILGSPTDSTVLLNANLNSTTGITTISELHVTGIGSIGIGTNRPLSGLDARGQVALFDGLGIGTNTTGNSSVFVIGDLSVDGAIGIGTTSPLASILEGTNNLSPGSIQSFGDVVIYNNDLILYGISNLGIGSALPNAPLDMKYANLTQSVRGVFYPPELTNSEVINITPSFVLPGALIYSSGTQEFAGYDGTSWNSFNVFKPTQTLSNRVYSLSNVGIGTTDVTDTLTVRGNVNVSGVVTATTFNGRLTTTGVVTATTFNGNLNTTGIVTTSQLRVGTGVTVNSGIVTALGGFTSGIGTAIQITTVGNKLFFTVPGVGTTSLTLF
jgi:hypothetical protein